MAKRIGIRVVLVEDGAAMTTVVDSGTEDQVVLDRPVNAFRPAPRVGTIEADLWAVV